MMPRLRQLLANIPLAFCVLWCASSVVMLCLPPAAFADDVEESYYQDLHKGYVDLSQRDPNATERARWDELIGEANAFVARELSAEVAPKSYFLLVRIHEHLFEKHKEIHTLATALEWCERLVQKFPQSDLADDALFALAELEEKVRSDTEAARRAYQRIVDDYPDSVYASKSEQRLTEMPGAKSVQNKKAKKGLFSKLFGADKQGEKSEPVRKNKSSDFNVHPLVKKFPRQPIVVIDPGHGGEEEGANGPNGIREKDVVLNISLLLEEKLRKQLKVKTVLTRVRDVTVELGERTQIANQHKADLFLSVHANASPSKRLSGVETYYLDNTNDRSSLRLAERENASSQQKMSDLGFMLSDLIQNAKLEDSVAFAHYIQDSLVSSIKVKHPEVRDLGVKKAPFYVLVGAHMPCVLAEVSFIDHKTEGILLMSREYQQIIADALFNSIVTYLEQRWIVEQSSTARVSK